MLDTVQHSSEHTTATAGPTSVMTMILALAYTDMVGFGLTVRALLRKNELEVYDFGILCRDRGFFMSSSFISMVLNGYLPWTNGLIEALAEFTKTPLPRLLETLEGDSLDRLVAKLRLERVEETRLAEAYAKSFHKDQKELRQIAAVAAVEKAALLAALEKQAEADVLLLAASQGREGAAQVYVSPEERKKLIKTDLKARRQAATKVKAKVATDGPRKRRKRRTPSEMEADRQIHQAAAALRAKERAEARAKAKAEKPPKRKRRSKEDKLADMVAHKATIAQRARERAEARAKARAEKPVTRKRRTSEQKQADLLLHKAAVAQRAQERAEVRAKAGADKAEAHAQAKQHRAELRAEAKLAKDPAVIVSRLIAKPFLPPVMDVGALDESLRTLCHQATDKDCRPLFARRLRLLIYNLKLPHKDIGEKLNKLEAFGRGLSDKQATKKLSNLLNNLIAWHAPYLAKLPEALGMTPERLLHELEQIA